MCELQSVKRKVYIYNGVFRSTAAPAIWRQGDPERAPFVWPGRPHLGHLHHVFRSAFPVLLTPLVLSLSGPVQLVFLVKMSPWLMPLVPGCVRVQLLLRQCSVAQCCV